jgi:hypothetical protein
MLFISIDPGITVGVYGALENRIFMQEYPISKFLDTLRGKDLAPDYINTIFIVEQAPLHGDPEQNIRVNKIESIIAGKANSRLIRILPGEWKPLAKAQQWASEIDTPSQHIKDAYCMLKFAVMTKGDIIYAF